MLACYKIRLVGIFILFIAFIHYALYYTLLSSLLASMAECAENEVLNDVQKKPTEIYLFSLLLK